MGGDGEEMRVLGSGVIWVLGRRDGALYSLVSACHGI
jgi:hypothetical protein